MPKPAISVIIPAYNCEKTISRTLDSVFAQSFLPIEVLVVNDASTDATIQAIQNTGYDVKILFRDSPGPGGYAARNLGITKAKGEWVSFLDADDTWDNDYLSSVVEVISEHSESCFICGGWRNLISDTTIQVDDFTSSERSSHTVKVFEGEGFFTQWLTKGNLLWTGCVSVKRKAIIFAGLFPEGRCRRGGDIDTWVRIILSGYPLYRIMRPLSTYYRDVLGSVTKQSISQIKTCNDASIRAYLREHPSLPWKRVLMRFSNALKMNGFKQHARYERVRLSDLRLLYWSVDPGFSFLCFCFAVLPGRFVRFICNKAKPGMKKSLINS